MARPGDTECGDIMAAGTRLARPGDTQNAMTQWLPDQDWLDLGTHRMRWHNGCRVKIGYSWGHIERGDTMAAGSRCARAGDT